MHFWKSDPLYRSVFDEVRALWSELPADGRPLLLRVEERGTLAWSGDLSSGRVRNVWLFDAAGLRLAAALRDEPHEFGRPRGLYSEFGLVRFHVARDRSSVALDYRLGPEVAGELLYDVEGEGEGVTLHAHSGAHS